ncbi:MULTISPECIES: HlyD family secretion protein [unclassified Aminobacter]|uniref:HlyD family secretion protein n=1 Tax=unclassified Aminobacter TaxID=2644704 RepID=UPI000466C716|nr:MULTISPECIES: HlyD family secretion protein [unclassified Aminobacter]TWH30734.1 membrane fusion protein (multidrug efflux system) [Aminobacter sp. J15]
MNAPAKNVEAEQAAPANAAPLSPAASPKKGGGKRVALMIAVPLALAIAGGYVWLTGGRYQETDNANLKQARITITSEIPGRIVSLNVHDNQEVKAGEVLFEVDPEPYRIALEQADAALAAARIGVEQLRAGYSQALAQERAKAAEVAYLESELKRARALNGKGVGSQSSLDTAQRDLDKARDEHQAAVESVTGALAALGGDAGIATDDHPSVLAALAARDRAAYQLSQTTVKAPASGVTTQAASVKLGQYVSAGTSLFTLVETDDTWIEANFKETQLTNMKVGQEAEVVLDTFPDKPLKAVVEAIGAGTGAEFSLLPAQNATGNWVKVTQRIPVRLRLTEAEAELLMRTGMSATVSVDTGVSRSFASLFGATSAAAAQH